MVVCSGGSEIKPGVAESVQITADHMAAILPPQLQILAPLYPYIRPLIIDSVSTFCASEPPGWPDLTGLTFQAILAGGEVGAGLVVAEALTQIAANAYWYLSCKCITGTTPAAPTATTPTQPVPVVNPPSIPAPTSTPCQTSQQFGPSLVNVTTPNTLFIIDQNLQTQFRVPPWTSGGEIGPWQNATSGIVHVENQAAGSVHTSQIYQVSTRAYSGAIITSGQEYVVPTGTTKDIPFTIPPGDTQVRVSVYTTSTSATNNALGKADIYCGVPPGGQLLPCCPPDPNLIGQLQQVLNLVTLIQRQIAPFGYVYGTNHTALSDTGSISVSDLIGVAVDVTTLPTSYGQSAGTPVELFDLGWVTLGTADGYEQSRRIDHDGTLFLPPAAGVYTSVGYTLHPGVVVSIRELVREP